jgi:hypothetical protein
MSTSCFKNNIYYDNIYFFYLSDFGRKGWGSKVCKIVHMYVLYSKYLKDAVMGCAKTNC